MIIHRGVRYQQGRGFGGFFSAIFRGLKPLFSMGLSKGKELLSSNLAKQVGQTALDVGKNAVKNLAADMLEGADMKESVNKELQSAKTKIAKQIRGSGKGKKRRKKSDFFPLKKQNQFNLLE